MARATQHNMRCTVCREGWHVYTGQEAPAVTVCPSCASADTVTANRLTCTACRTRLLRPSVDGMCGFCSPLGVLSAWVEGVGRGDTGAGERPRVATPSVPPADVGSPPPGDGGGMLEPSELVQPAPCHRPGC